MERNRQNSLRLMRLKRSNPQKILYPPCIVCGFPLTQNHHEGFGKSYDLCPNHHSAITRGYATLDEVLNGWPNHNN